jgi:hypothetical protein
VAIQGVWFFWTNWWQKYLRFGFNKF